MSKQNKSQQKKQKASNPIVRPIAKLLEQEERKTASFHNREFDLVRNFKSKAGKTRKPAKGVTLHKAVVMAPLGPPAQPAPVMAFSREHVPVLQLKHGANNNPVTSSVDLGVFREKKINTGVAWADTVMNGLPSGDSRYPDPFTLAKTTQTVVSQTYRAIPCYTTALEQSGSDYSFCAYGALRGSPTNTFAIGLNLDNTTTPYSLDWKPFVTDGSGMVWQNGGLVSTDFYTRPNGIVMDIIPRLVGPAHSVKMYAVPIQPLSHAEFTAHPAGWPTDPQRGLTGLLVTWGGREWELDSTSKGVRLVTLPLDSRCFDFWGGASDRAGIAGGVGVAWTSWIWWIIGLGDGDSVDIVCNCCEECLLKNVTTAAYAWPSTVRNTDTSARDASNRKIKQLAEAGLTGVSFLDSSIDFAKQAWGIGKKMASVIGTLAPMFAMAPVPNPGLMLKTDEEKKEDDFQSIERYERPTSVLSSSSSSVKVAASAVRKQ